MKLLFIDHAFHQKTHSSDFFLTLLRQQFEVEVLYVDVEEDSTIVPQAPLESYNVVMLWQMDFLAPYFLRKGIPTVVVPMYDGSANLPALHWKVSKAARYVSFSRTLHDRISAAGAESLCVKYYLPPVEESQLPTFTELRGILWMRRPDEGIHPRMVGRLLGNQLKSLHVHNAPDDGKPRLLRSDAYWSEAFPITESTWSLQASPYLQALRGANVFIAPRGAEGIGMTMLEAFAHGLLVIAHDDSVHDEYVANWINGILVHKDNSSHFQLTLAQARDIALSGWHGARAGYQAWVEQIPEILRFVQETPRPERHPEADSADFLPALWSSYLLGIRTYEDFLDANLRDLDDEDEDSLSRLKLGFDSDALHFGYHHRSVRRKAGFGRQDVFTGWLRGNSASFSFPVDEDLAAAGALLRLEGFCEGSRSSIALGVTVNNAFLGVQEAARQDGPFLLDFPVDNVEGEDWKVQVFVQAGTPPQQRIGLSSVSLRQVLPPVTAKATAKANDQASAQAA
jgi:hypothetical protein